MRSYTSLLLRVLLGCIGGMFAVSVLIDPYDIFNGLRLPGLNTEKTRRDEDGRRVTVGQAILRDGHKTILFGTSRVVEGFPRNLDQESWPGGLYNAGMRGGTAFETARALAVAGRSPELRCVVVGIDSGSFQPYNKTRATYWISSLPDGNATLAAARISLSAHAFYRSLQTMVDNVAQRPSRRRYPQVYSPGEQRQITLKAARSELISGLYFEYDPGRLEFFMMALQGLSARGVQIIGVILPRHTTQDEARFATKAWEAEIRWRRDLMEGFAHLAANRPDSPCVPDQAGSVLWDFSGYRMTRFSMLPSEQATEPHPFFYESTHFKANIGQAVLDRVQGRVPPAPFDTPEFGEKLTLENVDRQDSENRRRREAWLASDPDASFVVADFNEILAKNAGAMGPPKTVLSRDDLQAMKRDVERMHR